MPRQLNNSNPGRRSVSMAWLMGRPVDHVLGARRPHPELSPVMFAILWSIPLADTEYTQNRGVHLRKSANRLQLCSATDHYAERRPHDHAAELAFPTYEGGT